MAETVFSIFLKASINVISKENKSAKAYFCRCADMLLCGDIEANPGLG